MTAQSWTLAEPLAGVRLVVEPTGVWFRADGSDLTQPDELAKLSVRSPLGTRLPALIPQLLELGLAQVEGGDVCIPLGEFAGMEAREIGGFDDIVPWAPYTLELESSGWIGGETFRYHYRYYLGAQPVSLARMGSFVRRGDGPVQRLDAQSYGLVEAIDAFNALAPDAKTGAEGFLRFAEVRGLAEGVGAQLDRLLAQERVVVPPRIGLDVMTHEDGRISFVPRLGGVIDAGFQAAFLGQGDVEAVYAIRDERGGRVRVILSDDQREVLRRMQRARRLGGQERAVALRDPQAIFDGVAGAVEIHPSIFGPRVKGIGDFPFATQPYLRRGTGVLDIPPELLPQFPGGHADAGIRCRYADGREEDVAFGSVEEVRAFAAAVEEAQRTGAGTVDVRGKSVVVDDALVGGARELAAQFSPVAPTKETATRRFLLIFTNEEELEYEEFVPLEAPPAPAEIPHSLAPGTTLKQHQRDGLAWLQRNFLMGRHGCLLADDMGMGKSLQTLTFLAWAIERGVLSANGTNPEEPPWDPILIVAPVVLIENATWVEEMGRFFTGEGAVFSPWIILRGAELQRMRRVEGTETQIGDAVLDLERMRQFRVVITNYETVTNYQHSFARMKSHWSIVVTDEAQEYKVPSTKISHALKSLAPRFRVACTGTPVETRLLDLWNIFDFLQPGQLLGSASQFSKRFERATDADEPDLDGVRERLRYGRPDALLLRREKGNHLADLPAKHEHELQCELSPRQRQLHLDLLARARAGGEGSHPFSVISNLMRAYQHPSLVPRYDGISAEDALAQCPKLQVVVDTLHRIRAHGEKALIFTRHLDMQQLLASVIGNAFGRWPDIVNGAAGGGRKRADMLRGFRARPGFDVIILSPEVAGMGLTLTEANHVIHYGRWWNPAKEAQATDRAYRIGQTRPVHVYYPIATDREAEFETFDEKLHALVLRRRQLAAEFLAPPPAEEDLQAELLDTLMRDQPAPPVTSLLADRRELDTAVAAMEASTGRSVILLPRSGNEGVSVVSVASDGVRVVRCLSGEEAAAAGAAVLRETEALLTAFASRRIAPAAAGIPTVLALAADGIPTSARGTARLHLLDAAAVVGISESAAIAAEEARLASLRDFDLELRRAIRRVGLPAHVDEARRPGTADPGWMDALLASARYGQQRARAGRLAIPDDRMRSCLRPLIERGGRISRAAFAQRLNMPFSRMQSLLASMRLLLNVDGAEVLAVDDAAGIINLNLDLLRFQFDVDPA